MQWGEQEKKRGAESAKGDATTTALRAGGGGAARDALERKGPQRRLVRRLEGAKAVGGGYCRLQMPLKLALAGRETVAGHGLGALEGGTSPPPPNASWGGRGARHRKSGAAERKWQKGPT